MLARITVEITGLPSPFEGLRIAHLSDLHLTRIGKRERRAIAIVNGLTPDLILVTGDFVHGREDLPVAAQFIKELESRRGLWGVLGNREHWQGVSARLFADQLEPAGCKLLVNQSDTLILEDETLFIVGVDDPRFGAHDLDQALRDVPGQAKTILLAHSPEIADEAAARGIDLMLAGHTHGGQIAIPGFGPLCVPRGCEEYVAGTFKVGNMSLHVSRGLGTSLLPIRLFCPPEITEITLRSTPGQ